MSSFDVQAHLQQPVLNSGKVVAGTNGMTIGDLEDDILRGGKFRFFAWNFSVVVFSMRRSSPLTYVRSNQWVGPKAWLWSLPSFVVGWWGIPFGVIFTGMSLYRNAAGGKDVTGLVLQSLVGAERAAGVMARAAAKPADPLLWVLRLVCLAIPVAIVGLIASVVIDGR